jgi:hypothetical protein
MKQRPKTSCLQVGSAWPTLPRKPARFAMGSDLAVGTYHVEVVDGGFTVGRTIGVQRWFPLTERVDPAWLLWPTFDEASNWLAAGEDDVSDYPCSGCTPKPPKIPSFTRDVGIRS